jgi:hypothetical protein
MKRWKLRQAAALARALRPRKPTPLGALARGLAAGALGTGAQDVFFRATARWKPRPVELPPGEGKPDGQGENNVETVARRFTECMMMRGPLEGEAKQRAGTAVHYLFGAAWGALYGLWRESGRAPVSAFSLTVWMVGDNFLLPLFRLSAWPQHYNAATHAYAVLAHLAYGLGTAGAYALLRDLGRGPLVAIPALAVLQLRSWLRRTPPARLLRRAEPLPVRTFNQFLDRVALA